MKSSINKDGLLRVTRHCHYCGDSQTSPTVFSGLFRMPEEVIAEKMIQLSSRVIILK